MIIPDKTFNESSRLQDLYSHRILDSEPEANFDNITTIVSEWLDVPISLISLVDADRQWFKSHLGLEIRETPRDYSFCAHAIAGTPDTLVIPDTHLDERVHDNPLVTDNPHIRFYAGVPIFSSKGHPLGTLCAIDQKPRKLTKKQIRFLEKLARQVEQLIQQKQTQAKLRSVLRNSEELRENILDSVVVLTVQGQIIKTNKRVEAMFGYAPEELEQKYIQVLDQSEDAQKFPEHWHGRPLGFSLLFERIFQHKSGLPVPVEVNAIKCDVEEGGVIYCFIRDLTERKKVEEQLIQRETQYRLLTEHSSDGVALYENGKFEYISPQFYKLHGLNQPFQQPVAIQELGVNIHPDDLPDLTADVARAQKEQVMKSTYSYRIQKANDTICWIESVNNREFDEQGNLIRTVIKIRDVTSRKEQETALQESQSILAAFFDSPGALRGVVALHDNHILHLVDSKHTAAYFGKTVEQVKNTYASTLGVSPEIEQMWVGNYRQSKITGEPQTFDYEVRREGKKRYMRASVNFIGQRENDLPLFSYVVFDVTRQKNVENELRKKEALLEAVIQNIPFDLWARDKKERCFLQNTTSRETWGDMTGKKPQEVNWLPEETIRKWKQNNRRVLKGASINQEVIITDKSGRERHFNELVFPLKMENKITGFIGMNIDIAERKKHEEEILKAKKMLEERQVLIMQRNKDYEQMNAELVESNRKISEVNKQLKKANAELDSFVYRVSHDLRSPISSSLGLAKLATKSDSLQEVHNYSDLQIRSLTKLDGFIRDILNYSRNTRMEIRPESISLRPIIDQIVQDSWHLSPHEEMDLRLNLKVDQVIADRLRVETILKNLISNAFKYQNPYRSDPFVEISILQEGVQNIIRIADNGIGIKEEHQEKIFDMFYRASDRSVGSGIGLYILKECADKLEGSFSVQSTPGKGSSFEVTFPKL